MTLSVDFVIVNVPVVNIRMNEIAVLHREMLEKTNKQTNKQGYGKSMQKSISSPNGQNLEQCEQLNTS